MSTHVAALGYFFQLLFFFLIPYQFHTERKQDIRTSIHFPSSLVLLFYDTGR